MQQQGGSEEQMIQDAVAVAERADRAERFDQKWYVVWLGVLLLQTIVNGHDAIAGNGSVVLHALLAAGFGAGFLWILLAELRAYLRRRSGT